VLFGLRWTEKAHFFVQISENSLMNSVNSVIKLCIGIYVGFVNGSSRLKNCVGRCLLVLLNLVVSLHDKKSVQTMAKYVSV
jgi:hypothetical protein